jgi:thioredoxin reductase
MFDVIIIGGGPAGLSAALVLGRCGRRVLICDSGEYRNAAARHLHNFLSREGIAPRQLLRLGREQLRPYGVQIRSVMVKSGRPLEHSPSLNGPGFEITLANDKVEISRKLLLATGVRDILPAVKRLSDFYGNCVHHCPYCDGYEHRGKRLVAYGRGKHAVGLALALKTWSANTTACTNQEIGKADRDCLEQNNIAYRVERVVELDGKPGKLEWILFSRGEPLRCDAMFFNSSQYQRSPLPGLFGCEHKRNGHIRSTSKQRTCVPGLYTAGDCDGDVQFAIVAAAEGATAAVAINRELQDEGCETNKSSRRRRGRNKNLHGT